MNTYVPRALGIKGTKHILKVFILAVAVMLPRWTLASDLKWTEYDTNPVYGTPSSSDKNYYPCVLYDANQFSGHGASDYYKMWYADGQSLFEAVTYSSDGINWNEPVQITGVKASGYHARIIYLPDSYSGAGGTYYYKIWYWDFSAPNAPYTIDGIRTADSIDGVTWTNDTVITQNISAPLVTEIPPDWNRGTYGPVSVHYNAMATNTGTNPFDYTFAMYFDGTTGGVEAIGLGYSTDGNTGWKLYGNSPVLDHGIQGDWDSDYATMGVVIRGTDGIWRMWYSGSGPAGVAQQGIGYATSSNGILWTKDPGNPIFSIYQDVSWHDTKCYTPSVLYSSSGFDGHGEAVTYKMWFSGQSGATGDQTIGYARGDSPAVAEDDAYSTDEDRMLNVEVPGVLGNDTDVDGDTLMAVKVTDPAHGNLTLNADGSFSYSPATDWNGTDSFTYKANDGITDSNVATVTIVVNAVSGANDNNMYLARMRGSINWAKHANNIAADSLSISGKINPRGVNSNLAGATAVLRVSGIQLLPAVTLDSYGRASGVTDGITYKFKFDWLHGSYSFDLKGLDLRTAIGVPNATANILYNLPLSLTITNANMDIPLVIGTFECPCSTKIDRASNLSFNSTSNRTLTGVYNCSQTQAVQQKQQGGDVFNIKVTGVIEDDGGGEVVPTGDIIVKIGDAPFVIIFAQMTHNGTKWTYKGKAPGITSFIIDNKRHTFKLAASNVAGTGIPLNVADAPTLHQMQIQLQVPAAQETMIFDSTVEILRKNSKTKTWSR